MKRRYVGLLAVILITIAAMMSSVIPPWDGVCQGSWVIAVMGQFNPLFGPSGLAGDGNSLLVYMNCRWT